MTKDRAKTLLPIIEAFTKNKVIQYYDKYNNIWIDTYNPEWENYTEYRIKPEPKYIPFTFEDMQNVRDRWIKYKHVNQLLKITAYTERYINYSNSSTNRSLTYEDLLKFFVFEDGTPCGKSVE